MARRLRAVFLVLLVGCGGRTLPGATPDAGTTRDAERDAVRDVAADSVVCRVPAKHRPAGTACPQTRAPVNPAPVTACPDGGVSPMLICYCTMDADCT